MPKIEALSDFPDAPPGSPRAFLVPFREALEVKGHTVQGIRTTLERLILFVRFCEERGVLKIGDVTRPVLECYQRHLHRAQTQQGRPLSLRTQRTMIHTVKGFFKWLCQKRHLLHNPASELEAPRIPRGLPRAILSEEEIEAVLVQPNVKTPQGLRDRALLEVLYSTGIRRMEAAYLRIPDVDFAQQVLFVRHGKGRKERVVPLGARAALWLAKYLEEGRSRLVGPVDEGYVFVSSRGDFFHLNNLGGLVRRYVEAAGIGKTGACHLFRHSCATLMLEGGADVRFVQVLLGHESLETTQIYTRVSIAKLKEVHHRTHPAEASKTPSP